MIHSGEFKDINGTAYKVRITTQGNTPSELTLGVPPFVTEMDGGDDTIYKPVKYQSGTIKIISDDYLFDVYSSTAQGSKVELLQGNDVKWTGYVTPNLYDMGFDEDKEEIEIECIDALSTLQYYKYNPVTVGSKSVATFLQIIAKILTQCNAYQYFYISNNLQLESNGNESIIEKFKISEANFFDQKDDADETDEDVAWTSKEVLEQICQYLGYTCVADGDSVYFIDYDAIKNGVNTFYKYSVSNTANKQLVTLNYSKLIQASDYSENGATLSLDNVYNKVSVTDDLHTYEQIIPDMFKSLTNITKSADSDLSSSTNAANGMYGEVVQSEIDNAGDKANNNLIVLIDRVYSPQSSSYTDYNALFIKYFTNPNYKFYQYNGNTRTEISSLNYTDTKTLHGAFIAKFGVKKLDKTYSQIWTNNLSLVYDQTKTIDDWLAKNEISSVDFSNYIVLLNPETNHISNDNITNYPYFETRPDINTTAIFGGSNAYLVISGSCNFHYFNQDPYPIPNGEVDISEGRYVMASGEGYLLAKLQWGDQFWNGQAWTYSNTTFQIPYVKDDDNRRADNLMMKDNNFINTVSWRIGTKEKGHCIPVPNVFSGQPILTVYKPYNPTYESHGQYYKMQCVFLKDFQIKAVISDPTFSGVNDTDTTYTNIINESYVNELDEVKYKVCTWDNKNPNYSCVIYEGVQDLIFINRWYVNKVFNKALSNYFTSVTGYDGNVSDGSLRMEEQFIWKVTNQYSTPSIKLTLNLRNDNKVYGLYTDTTISGKSFIVDSINTDYKMNQQKVTLIEKK